MRKNFFSITMVILVWFVTAQNTIAQTKLYDLSRDGLSVDFSPDGKYIATGDIDGDVGLWEVSIGKNIYHRSIGGEVRGVAFSPDGKFIVSDGANGGVRACLLRTSDGKKVQQLNLVDDAKDINAVAYSPNGIHVAVGDDTGRAYLWNVSSGQWWWRRHSWPDNLYAVTFSPDGEYLATGDSNGYARIWEVDSWRGNVNVQSIKLGGNVRALTFSPNGRYLAADEYDGRDESVYIYDVVAERVVQEIDPGSSTGRGVTALAFSPDGRFIAVGNAASEIIIYRIGTEMITSVTAIKHAMTIQASGAVEDLAWSPDGNLISDGRAVYRMLVTPTVINPTGIGIDFPDNLISEEAFGTDAIYFILKAQHPILTGVSGVKYGSGKIFLDIPIDREIFIFPIPSKTKTEEARDAAKGVVVGVVVDLLIDLIPIRIPLSGTLQRVWDVFSKVQEAKEEQNYKLRIDLQNAIYDPERPEKEVSYIVLLRQKLGVRNPLSGINITMEQRYVPPSGVHPQTVEDTKFWRFGEGWDAPMAHPIDISDYPPFQLLPAEVQQYLLLQFSEFGTTKSRLIPRETAMDQNYPNPFNPETWIPYQLSEASNVTVSIYSVDGKLVRTLMLGHQAAGVYKSKDQAAYWDGKNSAGEPVASGVYFYTLTAGNFTATRKMIIRK